MQEKSDEGVADVKNKMTKLCKHFDILSTIISERASSRPLFTNEDEAFNTDDRDNGDSVSTEESSTSAAAMIFDRHISDDLPQIPTQTSRASPIVSRSKRKGDILELWAKVNASTATMEKERMRIEERKIHLKERRAQLDADKQEYELRAAVRGRKATGLSRQELRTAGVPDEEIESLLPLA